MNGDSQTMSNTASAHSPRPKVVIVGGGLAGLACAVTLAERNYDLTLLESRPRLGGRASSFDDAGSGELLDNCQHVSMGCCTNLSRFCQRLGIDALLAPQPELYFIDEEGQVDRFSGNPDLPAPLHLLPSFWRLRFLSFPEKVRVARAFWHLLRDPIGPPPPASFRDWLEKHGQSDRICDRFWSVVLVSALNEHLDRIDYRYARQVFLEGLLAGTESMTVYIPRVPLDQFYGSTIMNWLTQRGVSVRTTATVDQVIYGDDPARFQGVRLRNGETLPADRIVLATSPSRIHDLVGAAHQQEPWVESLSQFETSPITSVHLWYDRPVMTRPHLVPIGRTVQWLFCRPSAHAETENPASSTLDRLEGIGSVSDFTHAGYVQAVISASRDLVPLGKERILEHVKAEVESILPMAEEATLLRGRVVTERSATFSVLPGIDQLRPTQRTNIEHLYLAGDYTQTDWPATMEGAVRSGFRAAEALLADDQQSEAVVEPGLRAGSLVRWLAKKS